MIKPYQGRWIFTAALLAVVWFNAHWSVALTLTLISAYIETENYNKEKQE